MEHNFELESATSKREVWRCKACRGCMVHILGVLQPPKREAPKVDGCTGEIAPDFAQVVPLGPREVRMMLSLLTKGETTLTPRACGKYERELATLERLGLIERHPEQRHLVRRTPAGEAWAKDAGF